MKHKITEWFGWEGIFKINSFQALGMGREPPTGEEGDAAFEIV